jgi:PilZ domain
MRFPFVAGVQVTELSSEKQIAAHTQELSAYGCFIETITPFVPETKVRLRISRGGQQLVAQGRVVYSRPRAGMGVVFVSFEPGGLTILDKWLEDLRGR